MAPVQHIRVRWKTLLALSAAQMALCLIFFTAVTLNWVAAHRPESYDTDMLWFTKIKNETYLVDPIPLANDPLPMFPQGFYSVREVWYHWRGQMYICDITLGVVSIIVAVIQPFTVRHLRICAAIDFVLGGLWLAAYAFLQITLSRRVPSADDGCIPTARTLTYGARINGLSESSDDPFGGFKRYICVGNIEMAYITAILLAATWFITCGIRIHYFLKALKASGKASQARKG